jgi:hypothetical protein
VLFRPAGIITPVNKFLNLTPEDSTLMDDYISSIMGISDLQAGKVEFVR